MADGRNPWLIWSLVVMIGVLALSNWSWRQKPPSTLVARTLWHSSAQLAFSSPTSAWRLVVDLPDDLTPPGPEWKLYEGAQPGQGYELHWIPARLSLQVWRTGEQLQLLGSATLDRAPRQVVFARRGLRLLVEVDSVVRIACLDLQPPGEPSVCGAVAVTDVGGARLTLHDERRFLPPIERQVMGGELASLQQLADDPEFTVGSVHAIARVRVALMSGVRPGALADAVWREAQVALRALPLNHVDRAPLLAWMGWVSLRRALESGDEADLAAGVAALVNNTEVRGAGELPGLLLELVGRLAERAAARPTRPVPPAEVFAARRTWLAALSSLGTAVLDSDTGEPGTRFAPSEHLAWQLRLVVHAADCLIGRAPQPTPAEGPAWVADRWRAFAGGLVRIRIFPDPPGGPLAAAVQQLVSLAGFDPLPAVGLRAAVEDALERGDVSAAVARLDEAPPEIARQAALTSGILATRGLIPAADARAVLARPIGSERPLVVEDPLAFAIDRLLELGLRKHQGSSGVLPGVPKLPESLAWAAPILSGQPGAPAEVWRVQPDRPLEGLAAALLMQEIAGETPDWSLLAQAPAFTVPLRLLMPVAKAQPPVILDPPEPPVTQPVVP